MKQYGVLRLSMYNCIVMSCLNNVLTQSIIGKSHKIKQMKEIKVMRNYYFLT